ncbi:MAG: hypothetical protein HYW56_01620 [Candidatus Harrisonbacteria bacterium]|nr:hypothetical protein [Candidatus Harrisonbacteria bacterium]
MGCGHCTPVGLDKERKFRAGQEVWLTLTGAGVSTYEKYMVKSVRKGEVWLDNGLGSDPTGPFDANTGEYTGFTAFGFSRKITVEKPKDAKDK